MCIRDRNQGISCDYRYYSSGNALFDALSSGEVDAIIMNDTISSANAMPVFSLGESNYFFAVPKSRQDLMDDINTAMAMLRSTNPRYNDEVKTRYSEMCIRDSFCRILKSCTTFCERCFALY